MMGPSPKIDQDILLQKISDVEARFKTNYHDPNWMSFGYHETDQFIDTWRARYVFFWGVSIFLVPLVFILHYFPSPKDKDWTFREACFEIARREKYGLPHVDMNLIPPERVILPSDEELGDFEIII
ncbi:unnamed protein product [Gordionus sp. m RMFG-2023]